MSRHAIAYGEDALFFIPAIDAGAVDFNTAPTLAAGDGKLYSHGGASPQVNTNLAAEMVAFTSGSEEPASGDTLDGATSSESATFMFAVVTSGTWGGGDAAGFLFCKSVSGVFSAENLDINGGTANVMTIAGDFTAGLVGSIGNGDVVFALTATETQCKQGTVTFIDSATKDWEDNKLMFETFGDANALVEAYPASGDWLTTLGTNAPADWINAAAIAASALNGKGDWLTTLGTNAPSGWINAAAIAAAALNGKGDWLTTLGANAPAGWINAAAIAAAALNGKGDWATQADVSAITQAQRVRLVLPNQIERPDSGSTTYRLYIYAYNESHTAEDLDSNPTVTAENASGTDRSSNLGTVTKPSGTGVYYVDYTLSDGDDIEQIVFKVTATEDTTPTEYAIATQVVDTTAVDYTAADRTRDDAISTLLGTTDGKIDIIDNLVDQIIAKLPTKAKLMGSDDTDGGFDAEAKADISAQAGNDIVAEGTASAATAGADSITVTGLAMDAYEYRHHFLIIPSGNGQGTAYEILATSSGTTFQLKEGLRAAVAGSTTVKIGGRAR